jgi:hypothetical protein
MRVAATKPGDICWRRGVRYDELYSSFAPEMYVFEVQHGLGRSPVYLNASDAAEVGYLSQMLANDCAPGGDFSAHVDVYNATSNSWTRYPTGLGQARGYFSAASLPSGLVFFAGGRTTGVSRV